MSVDPTTPPRYTVHIFCHKKKKKRKSGTHFLILVTVIAASCYWSKDGLRAALPVCFASGAVAASHVPAEKTLSS